MACRLMNGVDVACGTTDSIDTQVQKRLDIRGLSKKGLVML